MKIILSFSLLLFMSLSHGEIYRWVDNDGKIHFSDKQPQDNTTVEDVSNKMSPINRDTSSEETQKLQQVFQPETPEERIHYRQQKEQQRRQDQSTKKACEQARYNLRIIKGRVYFEDSNGKEIIVTEEQREQRAEQLENEIRKHCA